MPSQKANVTLSPFELGLIVGSLMSRDDQLPIQRDLVKRLAMIAEEAFYDEPAPPSE